MPVLELSRTDAPAIRARALVFEAPASRELLRRVERLAPTDATVLITGATGTGKEIVARHLHDRSGRAKYPFVAVNCGALTPSLLESELFGHERGAFTGAVTSQAGWFETAEKGTLFLDEVGNLPLEAQVKLLRVLQEREVVRVGARRGVPVDVRLVAATNVRLEQAVAEGRFREDLYYRLHVAHLRLAPLRERQEDIVPLANHFRQLHASRLDIEHAEFTEGATARLLSHAWPGNIRELENVVYRSLLMAHQGRITSANLQLPDDGTSGPGLPLASPALAAPPEAAVKAEPTSALESALLSLFDSERPNLHDEIEEVVFRTAYRYSENNQLRTARLLGISRNVVRARLLQYGLLAAPAERQRCDATAGVAHRLRVGNQPFGVLSLLKATGTLEEALAAFSIQVEWIDCATGMDVIDALSAGALDIGVVGEAPPVFAQASRAPFVYLASEPPAPEGEAIIVPELSALTMVAELRGKRLAVSRGANVVYFVIRALEEAGLRLDEVDVRALSPLEACAAFDRGEVDAWAIWNPMLASLEHSRKTRLLRDARGLASNRAFYVGRRDFADARPHIVEAFVGQVGAVGRWANASRELAARLLAPHVGLPARAVEIALARTPFDARPLDGEAVTSQQSIADTFHRLRLISRPVNVNEAVWARPEDSRRSA